VEVGHRQGGAAPAAVSLPLLRRNFLDRVNVGFAALALSDDLGFSPSVFGVGAGIFFAGYILFEVPSNLAMQKFGARIWIARIMISWAWSPSPLSAASGASMRCASCWASPKPVPTTSSLRSKAGRRSREPSPR
jgi:hypothetical protein